MPEMLLPDSVEVLLVNIADEDEDDSISQLDETKKIKQ